MESEVTVSSAPEQGEATPFERLCELGVVATHKGLVSIAVTYYGRESNARHDQPLTTDDGTPIPFDTALQLASAQLLARLGDG